MTWFVATAEPGIEGALIDRVLGPAGVDYVKAWETAGKCRRAGPSLMLVVVDELTALKTGYPGRRQERA